MAGSLAIGAPPSPAQAHPGVIFLGLLELARNWAGRDAESDETGYGDDAYPDSYGYPLGYVPYGYGGYGYGYGYGANPYGEGAYPYGYGWGYGWSGYPYEGDDAAPYGWSSAYGYGDDPYGYDEDDDPGP